jgi:stage III sporulation protein AH
LVSGPIAPAEEAASVPDGDYFASARLTRQQARDSAITLLEQASSTADVDEAVATEAAESIQVLAAYTLAEAQIENMVAAKGYADCVAFMTEDGVSVVVQTTEGELASADVAKIKDIVLAETDYSVDQIKIMQAN